MYLQVNWEKDLKQLYKIRLCHDDDDPESGMYVEKVRQQIC